MSKSQKTYELEEIITIATARKNRCGCAEVALGDDGIVDYISIELGGQHIVRCYEIKISKSDFLSDAKKTFVGEYNYYVIPSELWMDIRGHVEPSIGVWCVTKTGRAYVKKKARPKKCTRSKSEIFMQIVRALNRENVKSNEEKWHSRQTRKPTVDRRGVPLCEGDMVTYSNGTWQVMGIEYIKNETELVPVCVIKSNEIQHPVRVKPSMLLKTNN